MKGSKLERLHRLCSLVQKEKDLKRAALMVKMDRLLEEKAVELTAIGAQGRSSASRHQRRTREEVGYCRVPSSTDMT